MFIVFYITVGLLLAYGILIGYYERAWRQIPTFSMQEYSGWIPAIKVTVIIPARNEEENIRHCLNALSQQTYPPALLEIIVVNDHSTDRTEAVVKSHPAGNIRLINLSEHLGGNAINSYKKKAIEVAVAAASGELIVTTDADCTASPDWIKCMAACHYRYNAAFIAAPVKITATHTLLSIFQSMDFLTLQGITGASVYRKFHTMCNGANLAYTKKAFNEAAGFTGIDAIASGDDMMLMHKIFVKHPDRVVYLKSKAAIVSTQPALTWKAFFQQRIRWASKAGYYSDKRITAVLLLVYLLNVMLLVLLLAAMWNQSFFFFFILLVVAKTVVEYAFVRKTAAFFHHQKLMAYFPLLQPLHVLYTVIAGWLGNFGHYEWKSRKVK